MSASDPVVIVGMARTPMGAMLGELAGFSANELGAHAIKAAMAEAGVQSVRLFPLWPDFQPEQLFYYVYAILHSNQYRQRFAQYLRMDFPRVPITEDYEFFSKLAEIGKELADIHLLKSPRLSPPLARYQGNGSNDIVEFIKYDEHKGNVQINPDKHFER